MCLAACVGSNWSPKQEFEELSHLIETEKLMSSNSAKERRQSGYVSVKERSNDNLSKALCGVGKINGQTTVVVNNRIFYRLKIIDAARNGRHFVSLMDDRDDFYLMYKNHIGVDATVISFTEQNMEVVAVTRNVFQKDDKYFVPIAILLQKSYNNELSMVIYIDVKVDDSKGLVKDIAAEPTLIVGPTNCRELYRGK